MQAGRLSNGCKADMQAGRQKIYAKLGNQHAMRPTPIMVALSSSMILTKLKIYA